MMKKLMVLSLVLAVAGVSNAAFSLDFDDVAQKFTVSNDVGVLAGFDGGIALWGPAATIQASATQAEGDRPSTAFSPIFYGNAVPAFGDDVWVLKWEEARVDLFPAGDWFSFEITGEGWVLGTADNYEVSVQLLNQTLAVTDTVYLIPEPMTMGLLGLGALFLRRRK